MYSWTAGCGLLGDHELLQNEPEPQLRRPRKRAQLRAETHLIDERIFGSQTVHMSVS